MFSKLSMSLVALIYKLLLFFISVTLQSLAPRFTSKLLTELSGEERVGQLFVLALLLREKEGQKLLSPRSDIKFDINIEKRRKQLHSFHGISNPDRKRNITSKSGPNPCLPEIVFQNII